MVTITHFQTPSFWDAYLSTPKGITIESSIVFNTHLLFLLTVIVLFVGWLLLHTIHYFIEYTNKFSSKFVHSKELEIIWIFVLALILLVLSTPLSTLLYAMGKISQLALTLKILRHQWFWSYTIALLFVVLGVGFIFVPKKNDRMDFGGGKLKLVKLAKRKLGLKNGRAGRRYIPLQEDRDRARALLNEPQIRRTIRWRAKLDFFEEKYPPLD